MPPLTDGQEAVLALLPIVPSLLSLGGSSTIIYVVFQHWRQKGRKTTVYHRLLVGMSLCDLVFSFWFPWMAFLTPSTTSSAHNQWSIGTSGTCTFMGFIFNFAFTGLLYNAMLSYYFLLTARFGWRDEDIAKRAEIWMHLGAVIYPITCAFVFVGIGAYDEQSIGSGCWLGAYPEGCGTEEGQEPCITPLLGWISAGVPVIVGFFSILINNMIIFCHVRKTIRKAKRHSFQHQHSSNYMYDSARSIGGSGGATQGSGFFAASSKFFKRKPIDAQTRRSQAVMVQAAFYVLVFFLNYIWTMVLRNITARDKYWTSEHESDLFVLLVLQAIFLPAQGFFNLCVFSRPKYLRTRKCFPLQSRLWCFRRAMFGDAVKAAQRRPFPRQELFTHSNVAATASTKKPAPKEEEVPVVTEDRTSSTTATFPQPQLLAQINEEESEDNNNNYYNNTPTAQVDLASPMADSTTNIHMDGHNMDASLNLEHLMSDHSSLRKSDRSSAYALRQSGVSLHSTTSSALRDSVGSSSRQQQQQQGLGRAGSNFFGGGNKSTHHLRRDKSSNLRQEKSSRLPRIMSRLGSLAVFDLFDTSFKSGVSSDSHHRNANNNNKSEADFASPFNEQGNKTIRRGSGMDSFLFGDDDFSFDDDDDDDEEEQNQENEPLPFDHVVEEEEDAPLPFARAVQEEDEEEEDQLELATTKQQDAKQVREEEEMDGSDHYA
ncbi:expressed unknown protein [Seminavis robusta]|uniref:G-protein coupled receptors family 2 profile 2 domain-containing protein n=1 Tax=Seminavis robusta TaxID=568900 RepID=A0A9N8E2Y8_9STRA|nr:expressed unknown protein [Seminavis robusta]|eukprot:Sro598_g173030.1 n/a (713) ;mRNA; f:28949-31087